MGTGPPGAGESCALLHLETQGPPNTFLLKLKTKLGKAQPGVQQRWKPKRFKEQVSNGGTTLEPKSSCKMGKAARPAGTLQGLEAHQHCGVTDVQGVLGVSAEPGTSSAQHLSLAQHLQPLTCQLCTGGVRTQSTTQVGNPDVSSLVPLSQCLGFLPKARLPK